MSEPKLDLDPVALHEAGHVLACLELGVPFQYVTLRPRTPGAGGLVRFTKSIDRVPPLDLVRVLAAGPIAELWLLDADPAEADGAFCSDLDVLLEVIDVEFGRGKRAKVHQQVAGEVHAMFQERVHELLTLAIRLERDRTLNPAEVDETCARALAVASEVPMPGLHKRRGAVPKKR